MFLPEYRTQEQIIVPTFRLDLIELSPKAKPAALPKKKVAPIKKSITKKRKGSKLKSKAKQLPPPKPIIKESKTRKKILEDLKSLESNSIKRSPLEQLDSLARLAPKVQEKKIIPFKAMQDETFREPDREKAAKLPVKTEPEIPVPPVDDIESTVKERESIALPEQLVKLDLKKEIQPTSALIKELEEIEKKEVNSTDILVDEEQFEKSNSVSSFKSIKEESLTSVVEKFQELENLSEEIKIDLSQRRVVLNEFTTSIQRDEVPVSETKTESETSSVLSLYVGEVEKRIFSNWKRLLGLHDNDLLVAFTIFSKGNITVPVIRKSAGDKNLDSIAVRAIIDSAPFPELPEDLHRPNLKLTINFKYVPE